MVAPLGDFGNGSSTGHDLLEKIEYRNDLKEREEKKVDKEDKKK